MSGGPGATMGVAGMRGKQTVRGMFQSMTVICAVAGVIYLFVPHDDTADPLKPVDYRVELVTAQRAAPYPVAAPGAWAPAGGRRRSRTTAGRPTPGTWAS